MWKHIYDKYVGIKRKIVREYVGNCVTCASYIPLKRNDHIKNVRSKSVWERIQIDLIDLRKFSEVNDGYSWLLTIIDTFSKYLITFNLKSKSSEEVFEIFKYFYF